MEVMAKIRYNHRGSRCIIRRIDAEHVECYFPDKVRAVTPGQAVVFYEEDYVVGGGTIVR